MSDYLKSQGYDYIGTFGCGSQGTVLKVKKTRSAKSRFAIKVCSSKHSRGRSGEGDSANCPGEDEALLLKRLRHPNIIKYVESFTHRNKVYIVMEIAEKGTLESYLNKRKGQQLPQDIRQSLFRQLVAAVGYLHSQHVYHGDIKPNNILLKKDMTLKLCDFGSAQVCRDPAVGVQYNQAKGATVKYAAQEIIAEDSYDPSRADIFSMGIVLYEMVEGRYPFKEISWFKGPFRTPVLATPVELQLLAKMLNNSPQERIDITSLLQHPYVRSVTKHYQEDGDNSCIFHM